MQEGGQEMLAIRKERLKRGWSLADVTVRTEGISESNLSMIERGLIPAYPGWQKRIAKAFKMKKADLFCEVEDDEQ
jgi:transcriptional regulator with XRE-family HTH domain